MYLDGVLLMMDIGADKKGHNWYVIFTFSICRMENILLSFTVYFLRL